MKLRSLVFAALCCLMAVPAAWAQNHATKTGTRTPVVVFPASEMTETVPITYSYYEQNGKKIKHGPMTANFNKVCTYGQGRVVARMIYTVSCAYKEGKLDGPFKILISQAFSKPGNATFKKQLTANYKDGLPHGKWSVSEDNVDGYDSKHVAYNLEWNNGELVSLEDVRAGKKLTFTPLGDKVLLFSGQWGGEYLMSVDLGHMEAEDGSDIPFTDEAKAALREYAAGTITRDELYQRGYILRQQYDVKDMIVQKFYNFLGYYYMNIYGLAIDYFDTEGKYLAPRQKGYYTYEFRQISFRPVEEIMETFKNEKFIDYSADNWLNLLENIENNHVYAGSKPLYFNDEAKEQIKKYLQPHIDHFLRIDSMRKELKREHDAIEKRYENSRSILPQLIFHNCFYSASSAEGHRGEGDSIKITEALEWLHLSEQLYVNYQNFKSRSSNVRDSLRNAGSALLSLMDNMPYKNFSDYDISCQTVDDTRRYLEMILEWDRQIAVMLEAEATVRSCESNKALLTEKAGKDHADVLKVYTASAQTIGLTITSDVDASLRNAQTLLAMQERCMAFIDARTHIFATNLRLTEQGKAYKHMAKVYATYYKTLDFSWTPESTLDKLMDVQRIQGIFEAAYAKPNAEELDKAVKASKDKTLETILQIL